MVDFHNVLEASARYKQIMQEDNLSQAYRSITANSGPDPQLTAFMDHDGSLSRAAGVESLLDLPTEQRHAHIMQLLDSDFNRNLALEAFSEHVRKAGEYLRDAGEIAAKDGTGAVNVAGVASKIVGSATLAATEDLTDKLPAYMEYLQILHRLENAVEMETQKAKHLPKTFDLDQWSEFSTFVNTQLTPKFNGKGHTTSKLFHQEPVLETINLEALPVKDSGWSDRRLKEAVSKYISLKYKLSRLDKTYKIKLDQIEAWITQPDLVHGNTNRSHDNKVMDYIHQTLGDTVEVFYVSHHYLHQVDQVIDAVSHHFHK